MVDKVYRRISSSNSADEQGFRVSRGVVASRLPKPVSRNKSKFVKRPFKPSKSNDKFSRGDDPTKPLQPDPKILPTHPKVLEVGKETKFKDQFKNHWKSFNNQTSGKRFFDFSSPKKFFKSSWKKSYQKKPSIDKRFNICLWVRQTYNNIFPTVTDSSGCVRTSVSGGYSKLRGNNRASYRSVEIITRILLKRIKRIKIRRVPFKTLCIFLVTPKNGVMSSLLESLASAPKIHMISSRIRIPHNGIRLKKLRRL
jgi:ribosomal protein S11